MQDKRVTDVDKCARCSTVINRDFLYGDLVFCSQFCFNQYLSEKQKKIDLEKKVLVKKIGDFS